MNKETGIIAGVAVVIIGAVIALFAFSGNSTSNSAVVDHATLVRPDSFSAGATDAKVEIVEFGDYQCPACGVAYTILNNLLTAHSDAKLVWRDFPLTQLHKNAQNAAIAANVAGMMGKFWPMHDKIYETQGDWSESDTATDTFKKYAIGVGLNGDDFTKAYQDNAVSSRIGRDIADGTTLGVNATPTLYFNGIKFSGNLSNSDLESAYQSALKAKK